MTISVIAFGLAGSISVFAATAPSLGVAANYGAWGKAGVTNNLPVTTTHIWGNVGADLLGSITNLLVDPGQQVAGTIDV